jgi:hypothetical protein
VFPALAGYPVVEARNPASVASIILARVYDATDLRHSGSIRHARAAWRLSDI